MLFFKCHRINKADFKLYSFQQILNLELKCDGINNIFYIVKGRGYRNGPKNLTPKFSFNTLLLKGLVVQLHFNRQLQTTGKNYGLYYEKCAVFSYKTS